MNKPAIDLYHGDEVMTVLEALDYTAEDYAYRADWEDKTAWPDDDDDDQKAYTQAQRKYSRLATTLRKRAGIV